MTLGRVVGKVVNSTINDGIPGSIYLLVDKTDKYGKQKGDFIVALDIVGAGHNELVMVSEGSPARETLQTINKPLDALIVGIIDLIDENDLVIYRK
jgi:microcompartment protein CcmK/EutM